MERLAFSSKKIVETELERRGLNAPGVKEIVDTLWNGYCRAEKQYSEITEIQPSLHKRSDLTTPSTFNLYRSYFDDSMTLTEPELIFLLGEEKSGNPSIPKSIEPYKHSNFAKKATRLGIAVQPHEPPGKDTGSSLFPLDLRKRVPAGFEQINDDLFCRKSNSFFVMNGPAVDSWQGTQPITKIFQPDNVFY